MKKIYFILLLTFSIIAAFAQQQVFTKVFYHNLYDVTAGGIIKTPDHHFIICGNIDAYGLIIKMDTIGNIVWKKFFSNNSFFRTIAPTHDSCFIVGDEGLFFAKMNQNGDTIWTRLIDAGNVYSYHPSLQETSDSGVIVSTTIYEPSDYYISVFRMNESGEIEWSKKITVPGNFTFNSQIKQTPDGGFILFGSSSSLNFNMTPFLLKLSSDGDYEWSKSLVFPNIQSVEAFDFSFVDDGIVLLTCFDYSFASIIKTDFDGNFVWGKLTSMPLGLEFNSNSYQKLNLTSDDGFVFTGVSWSGGWLLKLDSTGNFQWSQDLFVYPLEVIESYDGGYLIIGNGPIYGSKKFGTFNDQIGIIKTDHLGNSSDCVWQNLYSCNDITPDIQPYPITLETVGSSISVINSSLLDIEIFIDPGCVAYMDEVKNYPSESLNLSIYPNPSSGVFQVGINKQDISGFTSLAIFNIMGEKVFETTDVAIFNSPVDLRTRPEGVYFIRCQMGEVVLSEKIVVSHE